MQVRPALDQSCNGFWNRPGITGKMIQKPYLLAGIQQDLTGSHGNILATEVFTIAGSKKRKRSELALAIDRQGINIYDVSLFSMFQGYFKKAKKSKGSGVKADYILCDIPPSCFYLSSMLYSIPPTRR